MLPRPGFANTSAAAAEEETERPPMGGLGRRLGLLLRPIRIIIIVLKCARCALSR